MYGPPKGDNMRYLTFSIFAGALLTACGQSSAPEQAIDLHPFVGCWDTENGLEREGWTIDPSGWLIGYAASRDTDGNVTFFEHMRIETTRDPEMLVVTGRDNSETRFARRVGEDTSEYRFENPDECLYCLDGRL